MADPQKRFTRQKIKKKKTMAPSGQAFLNALPEVKKRLKGDEFDRAEAVSILRKTGSVQAIPYLEKLAMDPSELVCQGAIGSIFRMLGGKSKTFIESILLKQRNVKAVRFAINTLHQIGNRSSVNAIKKALMRSINLKRDINERCREENLARALVDGLILFKDKKSAPLFQEILSNRAYQAYVRGGAAIGLWKLDRNKSANFIKQTLTNQSELVEFASFFINEGLVKERDFKYRLRF